MLSYILSAYTEWNKVCGHPLSKENLDATAVMWLTVLCVKVELQLTVID